jgi:hypothetical protein
MRLPASGPPSAPADLLDLPGGVAVYLGAHPALLAFALAVLGAASLAAVRNIRLGRLHYSSYRICAMFFGLFALHWLLFPPREPAGLVWAALVIAAFWVLYAAVEPLIRGTFPAALISWIRTVDGDWRDPVGASHILGGITTRMLSLPVLILARFLAHAARPPTDSLAGLRASIGYTLGSIELGSATGLLTISALLVLRRIIGRKGWPTGVMVVLGGLAAPWTAVGFFSGALNVGVGIWLVNRFGWLALLASNIALQLFLGAKGLWSAPLSVILTSSGWALYSVLSRE